MYDLIEKTRVMMYDGLVDGHEKTRGSVRRFHKLEAYVHNLTHNHKSQPGGCEVSSDCKTIHME